MRIVMTLVLRDEEDILADNLDYHLSRGIDHVIATDHCSRDATPDILARYHARGVLTWSREEDPRFRQAHWITRMASLATSEHGADWVINNDADEFWWPRCGDLKDALASIPQEVGTLAAPRFNFMPCDAEGPFWETMIVRDERSVNPIGRFLPAKRCHRGATDTISEAGSYDLFSASMGQPATSIPVEILHFPDRSLAQLERAVAKHNDSRDGRSVPFTPRLHLARLYRGGALREHWQKLLIPAQAVRSGGADNRYRIDARFRDYMRALAASAATPP